MMQKCIMGGGGNSTPQPIDYSFLPSSNKANILASKNLKSVLEDSNITLCSREATSAASTERAYVNLSAANTNVTAYLYGKCLNNGEGTFLTIPYALSAGNAPNFYTSASSYNVQATVFESNTLIDGITCDVDHVYAISIDSSTKKGRWYVDGVFKVEKSFNNSGAYVMYGQFDKAGGAYYGGNLNIDYIGVVAECESDATIIANMQAIMSKMS